MAYPDGWYITPLYGTGCIAVNKPHSTTLTSFEVELAKSKDATLDTFLADYDANIGDEATLDTLTADAISAGTIQQRMTKEMS